MTAVQTRSGLTPATGTDFEYAEAVLAAVASMAVRSPRRQADLEVALRRFGIAQDPERLGAALESLQRDACIDGVVVLQDGGVLLQVTTRGIERLSHTARRFVADI